MSPIKAAQFVCLWAFLAPSAGASVFDDLAVHGFLTQGFVKTTDNNFFGDSEDGSFDFREIGLNASLEPSAQLRLSAQLLSRRAGEMYSGSPDVDFALADLSLRSTPSSTLNLLAGRVKNPLGLFNDTRDVAFTRPSIFMPQVIYFQKVRTLTLSSDGVAVRANYFSDIGAFDLQIGVGKPRVDENIEATYLLETYDGEFRADDRSWVGRLMFESANENVRLAISGAQSELRFSPDGGDLLTPGETKAAIWIASGEVKAGRLSLIGEYSQQPTEYRGYRLTPLSGYSPTMESYYAQVGWQVSPSIQITGRYEAAFIDRADRSGREFSSVSGQPAHTRFAKTRSIGVRWDISESMMVRAEYQLHHGTATLSPLENPDSSRLKPDWDLFALSLSYRF